MESWLPWFSRGDTLLSELSAINTSGDVRLVLVEPRRIRDRGLDILAEEADLAKALASTWGRLNEPGNEINFPRLHADPDAVLDGAEQLPTFHLLAESDAEVHDAIPGFNASGWGPLSGDASIIVSRLAELVREKNRVFVLADTNMSRERLTESLKQGGADVILLDSVSTLKQPELPPAIYVATARMHFGAYMPSAHVALITESDLTGRRRTPRRARPRTAGSTFQDLKSGDYVVHYHHGVGKFEGLVSRAIGGAQRDYLLLAYKGGDKLYVPTDQIDTIRQYVGG